MRAHAARPGRDRRASPATNTPRPRSPAAQALSAAGGAAVRGLGSLDSWLEERKLLPVLQRPQMDAAMVDADGRMTEECKKVGSSPWFACHMLCRGL
jgi:hypothetical protein